jgi:HTH-type transcriptional regulator, cell division transcriptional repressor
VDAGTLGGRIEQARTAQRMSLRQISRLLGVKSSTVANWERDRTEPRSNKLLMLGGILNVSMTWLLIGEQAGAEATPDAGLVDPVQRKLQQAISLQADLTRLLEETADELNRLKKEVEDLEAAG